MGIAIALVCGLQGFVAAPAGAAPGDLDRSFGGDGVVDATPRLGDAYTRHGVVDFAVGPRSEIFMLDVGIACERWSGKCGRDLLLSRFRRDGSRDSSFGTAAYATVFGRVSRDRSARLAADRQGRPIVTVAEGGNLLVARLDPDGRPDRSFGVDGIAAVGGGSPHMSVDVAAGRDGKIVVAGMWTEDTCCDGPPPWLYTSTMLIARYLPSGSLDPGFGDSGRAVVTLPQHTGRGRMWGDLTVQAGAAVFATGDASEGPRIARVGSGGVLDSRVGPRLDRAFARLPHQPQVAPTRVEAVIPRANGRIDILGRAEQRHGFMARLLPSGAPDREFGHRGAKLLHWSMDAAALEPGGRVFAITSVLRRGGMVAYRLNVNGSVDRTFGAGRGVAVRGSGRGTTAVGPDRRPVILEPRLPECRGDCSPKPRLIRFLGGSSGARCLGRRATIVGTRRSEVLKGTPRRDVIAALGGSDTVYGRGGDDLICGGRGDDRLFGGKGRDRLVQGPRQQRGRR